MEDIFFEDTSFEHSNREAIAKATSEDFLTTGLQIAKDLPFFNFEEFVNDDVITEASPFKSFFTAILEEESKSGGGVQANPS